MPPDATSLDAGSLLDVLCLTHLQEETEFATLFSSSLIAREKRGGAGAPGFICPLSSSQQGLGQRCVFVTGEAVAIARSFCSPSSAVCACALCKVVLPQGSERG